MYIKILYLNIPKFLNRFNPLTTLANLVVKIYKSIGVSIDYPRRSHIIALCRLEYVLPLNLWVHTLCAWSFVLIQPSRREQLPSYFYCEVFLRGQYIHSLKPKEFNSRLYGITVILRILLLYFSCNPGITITISEAISLNTRRQRFE